MSVTGPPGTGQVPQVESPSLVGQILDGRYRIVRKLGEGGMGEVFAAEHVHIEKKFAIKRSSIWRSFLVRILAPMWRAPYTTALISTDN